MAVMAACRSIGGLPLHRADLDLVRLPDRLGGDDLASCAPGADRFSGAARSAGSVPRPAGLPQESRADALSSGDLGRGERATEAWVGAIQSGTVGFFHDRTVNLDGEDERAVHPVASRPRRLLRIRFRRVLCFALDGNPQGTQKVQIVLGEGSIFAALRRAPSVSLASLAATSFSPIVASSINSTSKPCLRIS